MSEAIGKLRFRLVLLLQVDNPLNAAVADLKKEYQTVATRWGDIADFNGAQVFRDKNTDESLTDVILIRHETAFNNRAKITHVHHPEEDVVYEIKKVRRSRHRKRFLKLNCVHRGTAAKFNIV